MGLRKALLTRRMDLTRCAPLGQGHCDTQGGVIARVPFVDVLAHRDACYMLSVTTLPLFIAGTNMGTPSPWTKQLAETLTLPSWSPSAARRGPSSTPRRTEPLPRVSGSAT